MTASDEIRARIALNRTRLARCDHKIEDAKLETLREALAIVTRHEAAQAETIRELVAALAEIASLPWQGAPDIYMRQIAVAALAKAKEPRT